EFLNHVDSVVTLQRYARGYLVRLRMWRDAIQTEQRLWAAVEIQRCWRGYMGRLRWEMEYERLWSRETAALIIQRNVRGWLARSAVTGRRKRKARAEFEKARRRFKAAQKIQA
ncbi:MYO5A, partial [Symbiodinium sp. CCMP2592]